MKQKSVILNGRIIFPVLITFGFLFGVILSFLLEEKMIVEANMLNQDFLSQLDRMEIDKRALLFLCIKKRLGAFFLLWILSYSSVNKFFAGLFFGAKSIYMGSMMEILALRYGIKGIWLYLGLIMPHGVFYFIGFCMLGIWCFQKGNSKKNAVFHFRSKEEKILLFFAFVFACVGVILESYINPGLLEFILK